MKKAVVALAVVIGVAANAAEKFALQPVSISGGKEDAAATPGEVVTVKARGVGANKVEALKDAYRDAVERAVGLYVDAEQQVKNDAVLADAVLTQSNAYIQSYEIVKESNENGAFQVRILAKVKKVALTKRLIEVMPARTVNVAQASQDLHAQVVTSVKMEDDAFALVSKEFSGFDPVKNLLVAKLGSAQADVERIDGETDVVRLWYPVDICVDEEKYFNQTVPRMESLFSQIKSAPGQTIDFRRIPKVQPQSDWRISERQRESLAISRTQFVNRKSTLEFSSQIPNMPLLHKYGIAANEQYLGMSAYLGELGGKKFVFGGIDDNGQGHNICDEGISWMATEFGTVHDYCYLNRPVFSYAKPNPSHNHLVLILIKKRNSQVSLVGATYQLPGDSMKVVWDNYCAMLASRRKVEYELKFADAGGRDVCSARMAVCATDVSSLASFLHGEDLYWMLSPLVGGCAQKYRKWVSVDIAKDDIARIASVTIELAD